jgi:hypothetical protein
MTEGGSILLVELTCTVNTLYAEPIEVEEVAPSPTEYIVPFERPKVIIVVPETEGDEA